MKKTNITPYANIDWDKATKFFQNFPDASNKKRKITAQNLLNTLVQYAEKGIVFMAHAGDPAVVEYMLEGTGPLSWESRLMIKRFEKQHYVTVSTTSNGATLVKITKHGRNRALAYQLDTMKLQKQAKWDHKWRVVIFDVPEKHKRLRDIFRKRLRQLGLYQLQESVYVFPFPCFDEVEFLRELFGVAFHVRYLLVEKIEEDGSLREHFNLPA
jgi:hypothetical protein